MRKTPTLKVEIEAAVMTVASPTTKEIDEVSRKKVKEASLATYSHQSQATKGMILRTSMDAFLMNSPQKKRK